MSIAITYTLHCNGCRRVGPGPTSGSDSRKAERREARKAGWKRVPKDRTHPGADYCPECAPKFPEAK